jgi:hypothetical protein
VTVSIDAPVDKIVEDIVDQLGVGGMERLPRRSLS